MPKTSEPKNSVHGRPLGRPTNTDMRSEFCPKGAHEEDFSHKEDFEAQLLTDYLIVEAMLNAAIEFSGMEGVRLILADIERSRGDGRTG